MASTRGAKAHLKAIDGGLKGVPAVPDTIPADMVGEWKAIAAEMVQRKILTTPGLGLVEAYIIARWSTREAQKAIAEHGALIKAGHGQLKPNPATGLMSKSLEATARKFHQIATTVSSNVQGALVDLLYPMLDFLNAQNEAIRRNRLLAMDADTQSRYQENMSLMAQYLDAAGRVAPEIEAKVRGIAKAFEESSITAEEAGDQLRALATMNPDAFPITTGLSGVISVLELLIGRAKDAKLELASLTTDPVGPGATWEGVQALASPPKPTTRPGSAPAGGGGRSSAIDETERQAKAVQNLIAGLEFERSLIGLSAVEQQKLTTLRSAGAAATDEQRSQIERLVTETYNEQLRVDQLQATFEMLGQVGQSAIEGIIGSLEDGKITADEFGSILSNVLSMAANYFLGNAFSGLGSIFTGGAGGAGGVTMIIEIRSAS